MFKQFIVICLLAAFAAQTLNGAVIVINYYTNTASYAANCENKAKPMLHCNGRCQLLKKLKQEENKEKQNPERRADRKFDVLSSKSFFGKIETHFLTSSHLYGSFSAADIVDMPADFFHPPGA